MGLVIMILGLVAFLGVHIVPAFEQQRATMTARLGDSAYKGLFSLVSLIGILLIGFGFARYQAAGYIDIWHPPSWTRRVNNILMWPAIVCVVAAYIPGDIQRVLKHPMLVGTKLWAFAHLTANGDLGSIILFGSFLAWAAFDRIALKQRSHPGTPLFPHGGHGNDVLAVVLGTLLYLALGYWFHPYVVGVPAFAR
jgi:uncharacterized membrane protein